MYWYLINLFLLIIFALLFVVTRKSNKEWSNTNEYLGMVSTTVNSVRYGNLSTKMEKFSHPSYDSLSDSINRMVETLHDREAMIVEYQKELTEQNRFLESVINSLSDGILIVDDEYKITLITPKIQQWFGKEELLGELIFDYIQIAGSKRLERLKDTEIFIKDNTKLNFEASTMKLTLEDAQRRFVVLIKDTTSQRELDNLREDFVATLTHDLKVPIVAESNILDFLLEGKFGELSKKQKEAVFNMQTSNKELVDLVQILLETYKIKETGIELVKENIMLTEFINEVKQEMDTILEKSNLTLNFCPTRDLRVFADRIQLKRVIKNLVQNAISHSDTSENIEIKMEEIPHFIAITITDYGKGILPEDIKKIFNKYYSTAKKFRKIGTGLGLYLSQQIAKSHGGEIVVKSEVNQYTSFCVKLPI